MKGLSEKEKSYLFSKITKAKKDGDTLTGVFNAVSKKTGRAAGSIRNYYYKSVADGSALFKIRQSVPFSAEDEAALIRVVLEERQKVGSMRKALLNAAGGDSVLALRYRNKFSNLLKKQRAVVMREVLQQKQRTGNCYNPYRKLREKNERARLKQEIDELIKRIGDKCASENALLKKKLSEYERINLLSGKKSVLDSYFSTGDKTNRKQN